MKILAIETSSQQGSLALLDGASISACPLESGAAQSESALPRLKELLAESALSLADLDALAFGVGPGMFTGLRLGCGLAQGLALGSGLPLVPVSSLEALAQRCSGERVIAATDARMGEIYALCLARQGGRLEPLGPAQCLPPEDLAGLCTGRGWQGIGSAFRTYRDRFDRGFLAAITLVPGEQQVHASDLLPLAARAFEAGRTVGPAFALPQYVRDKVALTTSERLARGARA